MASFFDIIGVVFGVLGTLSAIPIVLQWLENRLPHPVLLQLEGVLYDIENLLTDLGKSGVIFDYGARRDYQDRMASMEARGRKLRLRTYQATTYTAQLRAYWSGLSKDISTLHEEAVRLRASICEAAIGAQDIHTPPYPPYTAVPALTHPPESGSPPAYTPSQTSSPPLPLRPALRPPLRTFTPSPPLEPLRGRARSQSLPPLHILTSPNAPPTALLEPDGRGGASRLRRRNAGQRKVQFDTNVEVLEFEFEPLPELDLDLREARNLGSVEGH